MGGWRAAGGFTPESNSKARRALTSRWESETVQPLRATARPCSERSRRAPPRPACRRVSRTNSNAGPRDARPRASTDALFVTAQTRRRPQVHHVLSGRMECGLSLQSDIDPSAGRRDQPPRRPVPRSRVWKDADAETPQACGCVWRRPQPTSPTPEGGGRGCRLSQAGWMVDGEPQLRGAGLLLGTLGYGSTSLRMD